MVIKTKFEMKNVQICSQFLDWSLQFIPLASKASREVANLTERKNLYTPVYGVKEFVCLSVVNFEPNYLKTG